MGKAVAQGQLGVEVGVVVARLGGGNETTCRRATLGADEGRRVVLAPVELGQHLVGGVAAPRAVALDLPAAAEVLGRGQEDAHVVDVAHRGRW